MVNKYCVVGGVYNYVQYGNLEVRYVDRGLGVIINVQYVIYSFEECVGILFFLGIILKYERRKN